MTSIKQNPQPIKVVTQFFSSDPVIASGDDRAKFVLVDNSLDSKGDIEEHDDLKVTPSDITSSPTVPSLAMALIRSNGMRSRRGKGGKKFKGDGTSFSVISQTIPFMKFKFPSNHIHTVTQSFQTLAYLTSSNVAFTNVATYFRASDITNAASYSVIFDQVKIDYVEFWVIPRNPVSPSGAAVNRGLLYGVIDYDDASALSSATDYESYENCVVCPAVDGMYRKLVPHMAVAAYAGAFTSYQNETPQWLDVATSAVQHYGVKFGVSPCDAAADVVIYDAIFRLTVSFRNVR